MVTMKQVERGVAAYLDAELMPQFSKTGVEKVIAGTAISLFIRRSGVILEGYKENKIVQMLGIMDEEGNVDVELLSTELKKNIPDEGFKMDIPMIGAMTFHKEDVTKLQEYITEL